MLDTLQKQFGSPQIQFSEGKGGLTKVTITTPTATAEIYLHGAHVTHFQPAGHKPLLYTSSASAFQPGKPIRGGVPICWPWFGPSTVDPKLPMHGIARINAWGVESARKIDDQRTCITFRLDSNEATRQLWPHDFVARYSVTVGSTLELELEMTNRDKAGVLVSEALHSYLSVGDVQQISLGGLTGTSYFDKVANVRKIEERDPVRLTDQTDNVYFNTRTAITVHDPVLARKIRVEKSGSSSTVIWNPFEDKARTIADIGAGEWRRYICVEAANAMENTITVAPGATHKISTTLKVI